jgi:hypothetical protein
MNVVKEYGHVVWVKFTKKSWWPAVEWINAPNATEPVLLYPPIGNAPPMQVSPNSQRTAVPFTRANITEYVGKLSKIQSRLSADLDFVLEILIDQQKKIEQAKKRQERLAKQRLKKKERDRVAVVAEQQKKALAKQKNEDLTQKLMNLSISWSNTNSFYETHIMSTLVALSPGKGSTLKTILNTSPCFWE